MKYRCFAALALAMLLPGCAAAPDLTPVWQRDLPASGVHIELANAALLSDADVYYAATREELYVHNVSVLPAVKADGQPVTLGGIEKMSKSKNNVVEPREIIKKFGADTARSFVMFAGPPDQSAAWSNSGAEGTYRFLRRIWNWAFAKKNLIASAGAFEGQMLPHDAKTLRREVHTTLRQAEYDFSRMQYNTVVSACMKMFNTIEGFKGETPADLAALCECASILLRTLYPIAPHITTALWQELGFVERIGDLIDAPWPEVSEDAIKADELKLVVQVNGKLRGEILVPAEAAQAEIEAAALANPDVQRFTEGMTVRKIIIVKNKLVNVVVAK